MAEVENFVAAVKEKRDEALAEFSALAEKNQGIIPSDDVAPVLDTLITKVLDLVEESATDLVSYEVEVGDDGDTSVTLSGPSELTSIYFEQVSN